MPIVGMPDGTQVQFPDDMPAEQIRGLISQKFPDAIARMKPAQPIEPANPTPAATRVALDFMNQGSAAGQRTTPNIAAQMPNLISADTHVSDAGELLFKDQKTGQLVPTDQNKHVALRDPADNRIKVFARTPDTDEGATSAAGRLLMTGMGAGAPNARPSIPVPPSASAPASEGAQVAAAAARLSESGAPVTVPKAVASDSMATQRLAATARNVPLAGDPLVAAADRTIGQLGSKADELARGIGSGTAQGAGDTAKGAIRNWIKGTSEAQARKLYDSVDNLVSPESRIRLDNTRNVISEIAHGKNEAHLPWGKAVDMVTEAATSADGLTYEAIKTLRTAVGENMSKGILPEGMSGGDLKRIYSALTDDLRSSALVGGGEKAVKQFDRANKYYALISGRREALAKIVGADGDAPAEKVFDRLKAMAGSSSRADVAKLSQARKAIGAEDWNEFASGVVAGLGRDAAGDFSPALFVRDYGKLTDAGKSLLFKSGGKSDLMQHLDDIATISARHKELAKFSNPSGTGQALFGGGIGAGLFADPLTTAGMVLGGRVVSYALSRPATAASLVKYAKSQEALARNPSTPRLAAFSLASRNLINTLGDYGRGLSPQDFIRGLQGGVPARAQDEER